MTDPPPPVAVLPDALPGALLDELVDRALEPQRALLLPPDEVEDHRRFLRSLAATHPAFSKWIEAQRPAPDADAAAAPDAAAEAAPDAEAEPPPRDAPDRSGIVERHDRRALEAAARRTATKGRRR